MLRVIFATVEGRRNLSKIERDAKFNSLPEDSRLRPFKDHIARLSSLRRTNILLRPQISAVVRDLLDFAEIDDTVSDPTTGSLDPKIAAEQKILLALHPSFELFKYCISSPNSDKVRVRES